MLNNQELLDPAIISFIFMTRIFDSGVILLYEIRCLEELRQRPAGGPKKNNIVTCDFHVYLNHQAVAAMSCGSW